MTTIRETTEEMRGERDGSLFTMSGSLARKVAENHDYLLAACRELIAEHATGSPNGETCGIVWAKHAVEMAARDTEDLP